MHYVLIADNACSTEDLGRFDYLPTMADVPDEYRGYTIAVYRFQDENDEEGELIEIGETARVNEGSDELLTNVQSELARRLGIQYFSKYQTVYIDEYGRMFGTSGEGRTAVTVRLADHTHAPHNGRCDLNVVIAEKDATVGRFRGAKEDLRFRDNDDLEYIVNQILHFFEKN